MDATQSSDYFAPERIVFAPCRAKCPAHIDVPGYLSAVAEGRYTDALEIVLSRNPLPSVCGRICLRPCEDGCRRCSLDDPVAIAQLKRAAADFGAYPVSRPPRPRPESVAIVGGGPAGLTAAHDLAQVGIQATIYEAKPLLGGMLRYGIPNYRLPDYALDRDIHYILGRGVSLMAGVRVGVDVTVEQLLELHHAVIITAGLQSSRAIPIPGHDHERVLTALPFLEAASRGEKVELGDKVVVVGGGNVAMDVARTARRLGAKDVHVTCLEAEGEMPASAEEVHEARLEGVKVHCSWGPAQVVVEGDGICALESKRCTAVFDKQNRFAPVFDESQLERFETDTIIFATGQGADAGSFGVELTPRGLISADAETCKTSTTGVYAAGDVVSGPTKVIDAIAQGHRVAASVVRDLTGNARMLEELRDESAALGKVPDTMKTQLETRRRVGMEKLEFYEAVETFDEIEAGYTEYEAAREAQRCLGCTAGARLSREKCASCLTCMRVCPHGAPSIKIGGYLYFDAEACHACGACASQCPAQAINLEGHSNEEMLRRVERALASPGLDTTLAFACGCTPNLPELPGSDVRLLTVTCLLRVSENVAIKALSSGARRLAFEGCVEANCRYPHARELVRQRMDKIRDTLEQVGMDNALFVAKEAGEEDVHLR